MVIATDDRRFSDISTGEEAGPGWRHGRSERGARAALVDQGIQGAMAEQGTGDTMVGPPPRTRPQPPPRPLRLEPCYPQKKFLGESRGWFRLALWRSGHLGALWRCRHSKALSRGWHWSVLWAGVSGGQRAWFSGLREPRTAVLISPWTAGMREPRTAAGSLSPRTAGWRELRTAFFLGLRTRVALGMIRGYLGRGRRSEPLVQYVKVLSVG